MASPALATRAARVWLIWRGSRATWGSPRAGLKLMRTPAGAAALSLSRRSSRKRSGSRGTRAGRPRLAKAHSPSRASPARERERMASPRGRSCPGTACTDRSPARAPPRWSRKVPVMRRARSRAPSTRLRRRMRSVRRSSSPISWMTPRWPSGPRSTLQRVQDQAPSALRRRALKQTFRPSSRASMKRSASSGCSASTRASRSWGGAARPSTASAASGITRRSPWRYQGTTRAAMVASRKPWRPVPMVLNNSEIGSRDRGSRKLSTRPTVSPPTLWGRPDSSRSRLPWSASTPELSLSDRLRSRRASSSRAPGSPSWPPRNWITSSMAMGAMTNSGMPHRERNFRL